MQGGGRGWLEGTLDVISGMTPRSRPSTPVMATVTPGSPRITRLPSQDSLDRSIHNDSSHGNTAKIIRDLKASNARLTAKTAEMEADFMNQLANAQKEHAVKLESVRAALTQKETQCRTLEARLKQTETRYSEQSNQLIKLKEENAFQRHSMSELRAQLVSVEVKSDAGSVESTWLVEKERLLRELDALKEEVSWERQERIKLQENHGYEDKKEDDCQRLERTQDALYRTESALAQLQQDQKKRINEHEMTVSRLEHQLEQLQDSNWQEDWQRQLHKRDVTIEELRNQVIDYSTQLTEMTERLTQIKADADAQEQYRKEEAEDLRVLADAQEEEMEKLRMQLEEALSEIELREQELEEKKNEENRMKDEIDRLRKELRKKQVTFPADQVPANEELEVRVTTLKERIEALQKERDELLELADAVGDDKSDVEASAVKVKELEIQLYKTEDKVANLERLLDASEEEKSQIKADCEKRLAMLRDEMTTLEHEYNERISDMQTELKMAAGQPTSDEVQRLSKQVTKLEHSASAVEDDLRRQLRQAKREEETAKREVQVVIESRQQQINDLRERLADRDTTITTLVKSTVGLEEQLAVCRIEINSLRKKLGESDDGAGFDVIFSGSASEEEVAELKSSLERLKIAETRLSQENARLKKQIQSVKNENTRLMSQLETRKSEKLLLHSRSEDSNDGAGSDTGSSVISASPQVQIEERDNAIAALVMQSIEQDKLIASLQSQVASMTEEVESLRFASTQEELPSWEEVKELRRETEMFAGQVIEQDEEIESLKCLLQSREDRIVVLEREVEELRDRASPTMSTAEDKAKITSLKAEIDELEESNKSLMDEIRLLRRKANEVEQSAQDIDLMKRQVQDAKKDAAEYERMADELSQTKTQLLREVEDLRRKSADTEQLRARLNELEMSSSQAIKTLELKLHSSQHIIDNLKSAAVQPVSMVDEAELDSLKDELQALQRNFDHQSLALDSAKETIRELERSLAEKNAHAAAEWDEEKEELISEVETLTRRLEEAKVELAQVEEQKALIDDFKLKLEEADEAREVSEKTIVETYERKLSLLKLDKDVLIDKLRKELTETKADAAEEIEELTLAVEKYEAQIKTLHAEAAKEVQEREQAIFALEHTLEAQQQLVHNMKTEMDQLQGSMESKAVSRREEIESMQKELVDLTSKSAQQEREIKSLQGQLEDRKIEYESEINKLKATIASMESEERNEHRNALDLQMELRLQEVKGRLEKLRWRNNTLTEENTNLRDRLVKAEEQLSSMDGAKEIEDLKKQLESQKELVSELENELKDLKEKETTPPPAPSTVTPAKVTPNKVPQSPARNKRTPSSPRRGLGFLGRRGRSNPAGSSEEKMEAKN